MSAKNTVRVGFVGCGAMGGSIARGLLESHAVESSDLAVADLDAAKLKPFADAGAAAYVSPTEMLSGESDLSAVVLAVKPQVLPAVLAELTDDLSGRLVVSIAAGVKIATLESALPDARVIRVMPNLPMSVLSGAAAIAAGTRATSDDVELVRSLLSALGSAQVMREDQLDVEGAVVGCAPAYFALFVDAFTRASVRAGLTAAASREMLLATMGGVATSLLQDGTHPRAYMEQVTSPGGTTARGLEALEPLLLESAYAAVDAALARTAELASS